MPLNLLDAATVRSQSGSPGHYTLLARRILHSDGRGGAKNKVLQGRLNGQAERGFLSHPEQSEAMDRAGRWRRIGRGMEID